ncbi:hypothetical protein BS50DRAFT_624035 [Corynespora cassiicola Philippines]|uniref:Uncharacterized protein n=1 Tax=Corynespora cassiicola Philippines TaxID=1448308 RepID=A0A2T2NCS9_CORCC|nr:hypothetical protein BS50DRAFT_624035 [Corynespora cassiicola Philippines]
MSLFSMDLGTLWWIVHDREIEDEEEKMDCFWDKACLFRYDWFDQTLEKFKKLADASFDVLENNKINDLISKAADDIREPDYNRYWSDYSRIGELAGMMEHRPFTFWNWNLPTEKLSDVLVISLLLTQNGRQLMDMFAEYCDDRLSKSSIDGGREHIVPTVQRAWLDFYMDESAALFTQLCVEIMYCHRFGNNEYINKNECYQG